MGANTVRLAHYQHDPRSYEIADERGIVAWAEIPLVNQVSFDGTPASEAFSANATPAARRAHPPELQPPVHRGVVHRERSRPARDAVERPEQAPRLVGISQPPREERGSGPVHDPRRLLRVGLPPHTGSDIADIAPRDSIVGVTDVVGYNRYFGWYTGGLADFGVMLDAAHARHARLPLSVSEYGAGAALTQHSDDPGGGPINPHGRPHPEEVQNLYHEASWSALRTRPYVWGHVHLEPVRFLQRLARGGRSHGHQRERSREL